MSKQRMPNTAKNAAVHVSYHGMYLQWQQGNLSKEEPVTSLDQARRIIEQAGYPEPVLVYERVTRDGFTRTESFELGNKIPVAPLTHDHQTRLSPNYILAQAQDELARSTYRRYAPLPKPLPPVSELHLTAPDAFVGLIPDYFTADYQPDQIPEPQPFAISLWERFQAKLSHVATCHWCQTQLITSSCPAGTRETCYECPNERCRWSCLVQDYEALQGRAEPVPVWINRAPGPRRCPACACLYMAPEEAVTRWYAVSTCTLCNKTNIHYKTGYSHPLDRRAA